MHAMKGFVFYIFLLSAFCTNAYAEENVLGGLFNDKQEKPPTTHPHKLPTFNELTQHYNDNIPALIPAPLPDSDAIFQSVVTCYPVKPLFDIDISLQAALMNKDSVRGVNDNGATDITSNYVGIVAKMPLYSTTELHRARDKEYSRRQDTAKQVASFVAAIAKRNHAVRKLSLYGSLEKRSQLRVQQGLTRTDEQVGYLEKVAAAQEELIIQRAAIMEARLALSGQCRTEEYEVINDYLHRISKI